MIEFLALAVVGFFVVRWYKKLKAVQFIQACDYLYRLEKGETVEQANGGALRLCSPGSHQLDNALAERNALMFAAENTLGRKSPIIAAAKDRGFLG